MLDKKAINQEGVVLILALILMMVIAITVGAYIFMVNSNIGIVNIHVNDTKALYYAEAGLNKAVWYLMNIAPDLSLDGSWRTIGYPAIPGPNPNDPQQEDLGEGSYSMWVENSGVTVLITAQGQINNATRTIQQEFDSLSVLLQMPQPIADSWREI